MIAFHDFGTVEIGSQPIRLKILISREKHAEATFSVGFDVGWAV